MCNCFADATFGLEQASCSVNESMVFSVCVVLKPPFHGGNCPVMFDFDLHFSVMDCKRVDFCIFL